jgi:E3 ubiquitin-protein ligase TRIP12
MEGDEGQWVDERPGPSRSRLIDDEDQDMPSDHDDDDDDEDENSENDEAPPAAQTALGGPNRNAYERLARLAGESGMHLDEATAMALFGGEFRNFGGMAGGAGTSSRFKRLKNNLRSKNVATRLSALRECSELLLVSNEDTLGGTFSTNTFATEFIAILKGQPNIDEDGEDAGPSNIEEMDEDAQLAAALAMSTGGAMPGGFGGDNEEEMECQLVACRCLAHLLEALPGTAHTLVHLGAVPVLCSKLNEIAYIELAEQTLSVSFKTLDVWA